MAIILYDAGEALLQSGGWGGIGTCVCDLYLSNTAPAHNDTIANYTISSFPGYAQQTGLTWTVGASSGGSSAAALPKLTYIATGASGQSIYGFVVRTAGGVMLCGGLFPGGPYSISGAGSGVQFTPTATDTY